MKYFVLYPQDQAANNWLLFEETPAVVPRARYADLKCVHCQKLDEFQAVRRGFDADVRIVGDTDFVSTNDGFICARKRLADLITKNSVCGVETLALPGDDRYMLLWPTPLVRTNREMCRMRFERACPVCFRPREALYSPVLWSMSLPTRHPTLFASEIWGETSHGRATRLYADERMIGLLEAGEVTGMDWEEALQAPMPPAPKPVTLEALDAHPQSGLVTDIQRIEGFWELSAVESNGEMVKTPDDGKLFRFMGGSVFVLPDEDRPRQYYRLDPAASPPHIDLDVSLDPKWPRLGIYHLQDDFLLICSDNPNHPRPRSFSLLNGAALVSVLRRVTGRRA